VEVGCSGQANLNEIKENNKRLNTFSVDKSKAQEIKGNILTG